MKTKLDLHPQLVESYENEGYTNFKMGKYEIQKRLDAHGINLMFMKNDELFAADDKGNFTINTTDWTLFDFLHFINY